MSDTIVIDFEAYYAPKLKYSLTGMIAEQYCKHHLFDPYMISVTDGSTTWAGSPKDFNWKALPGNVVLAHNAYFEQSILQEMENREWIPKGTLSGIKEFHCTANMTAYLCNRRSLAQAAEFLLGEKVDKAVRSDAKNKRWPDDFSKEEREAMIQYAKGDVITPYRLWQKFSDRWPAWERQLSRLTIDQGRYGVQIDTDLLENYLNWVYEMKLTTEGLLPWLEDSNDDDEDTWEGYNKKPTSTKCIAEQCRRSGIPCPPVKSRDADGFEEWESTYSVRHPWIKALGSWRSINKLYKTFLVMKERIRPDGTMPFGLKYFGAHTGRWSGSEKINMQNPRKLPVFCNEQGLMETNEKRIYAAVDEKDETGKWSPWVQHAIDFRALILPRPGKKMIVCDLAQIEPRVLNWLAGNHKLLDLIKGGTSVYEAHARATMGYTEGNMKKLIKAGRKDIAKTYALAKARVLSLGYQAGWEKFITMAFAMARLDITVDDPEFTTAYDPVTGEEKQVSGYGLNSRRIVQEFREANPLITGMWARLDAGFKGSVGSDFTMTLPSGRVMRYSDVRCQTEFIKDDEGRPKRKSVYTANVGGFRKTFYGGKLTENITQAVARDIFGWQMTNMDTLGWGQLFSSHDEDILEVDNDVSAEDVEHEMSRCPDWMAGCPVAGEAEEVAHYKK